MAAVEKARASILEHQYDQAVDYRVLGPLEVLVDGDRSLSAVRSSGASSPSWSPHAGRPVTVDTLLQAIYGEDASPTQPGDTRRPTCPTFVTPSAT